MIDISILISCYNKLSNLEQSLNSLIPLLNLGCEVIIIDDGSNDGSEIILQNFTFLNPDIKLFRTKNLGSANARNTALQLSTKQFVFFLDIDDALNVDVLKKMFRMLIDSDYSLCIANYSINNLHNPVQSKIFSENINSLDISESRNELFDAKGFWRILYRKEFIVRNKIYFGPTFKDLANKYFILDDIFWLILLYSCEGRVLVLESNSIVYQYNVPEFLSRKHRKKYRSQISLLPQAIDKMFGQYVIDNENLNRDWFIYKSVDVLFQHLNYLKLYNYLTCLPLILRILYRFEQLNSNSSSMLIKSSMYCLKNSLYPISYLKHIFLVKIRIFLEPILRF